MFSFMGVSGFLISCATCLAISRQALSEARLGPGDIEKVILVGGPSLAPYVREQLSDPKEGLGIKLDFSYDPLTVVAMGAAIFAGTQRVDMSTGGGQTGGGVTPPVPPKPGTYNLELEYNPVGADQEPLIGGKIQSTNGENFTGFSIEFIDSSGNYRSGKIPVGATGAFMTTLLARSGAQNTYRIELTDASGRILEWNPALERMTGWRREETLGQDVVRKALARAKPRQAHAR